MQYNLHCLVRTHILLTILFSTYKAVILRNNNPTDIPSSLKCLNLHRMYYYILAVSILLKPRISWQQATTTLTYRRFFTFFLTSYCTYVLTKLWVLSPARGLAEVRWRRLLNDPPGCGLGWSAIGATQILAHASGHTSSTSQGYNKNTEF